MKPQPVRRVEVVEGGTYWYRHPTFGRRLCVVLKIETWESTHKGSRPKLRRMRAYHIHYLDGMANATSDNVVLNVRRFQKVEPDDKAEEGQEATATTVP